MMIRIILFMLALFLPLWGDETVTEEPVEAASQTETVSERTAESTVIQKSDSENFNLEAHIAKIKAAKGDERRLLMNELKAQLRVMNQENRSKALKALGQSLGQGRAGQHRQGGQAQQNMQQHQQRMGGVQAGRGRP